MPAEPLRPESTPPAPAPQKAPPLHSKLERALRGLGDKPVKAAGVYNLAKKAGVPDEEWHATEMPKALEGRAVVHPRELLAHYQAHSIVPQETWLGENYNQKGFDDAAHGQLLEEFNRATNGRLSIVPNPEIWRDLGLPEEAHGRLLPKYRALFGKPAKYSSYQTPGGEDYRELLLTLPAKPIKDNNQARLAELEHKRSTSALSEDEWHEINHLRKVSSLPDKYVSPHWEEPNVLAHVRMNDRESKTYTPEQVADIGQRLAKLVGAKTPDSVGPGVLPTAVARGVVTPMEAAQFAHAKGFGAHGHDTTGATEKTLHVEEVQSDWHQAGRKTGYRPTEAELQRAEVRSKEITPKFARIRDDLRQKMAAAKDDIDAKRGTTDEFAARNLYSQLSDVYSRFYQRSQTAEEALEGQSEHVKNLLWEPLAEADRLNEESVQLGRILSQETRDRMVPQAPYKESWPTLALKRVLHHAAENGYDRVSINPGHQIQSLVGGEEEGQNVFYDRTLPNILAKLGKPHGVTVEPHTLNREAGEKLAELERKKHETVERGRQLHQQIRNHLQQRPPDPTGNLPADVLHRIRYEGDPDALESIADHYGLPRDVVSQYAQTTRLVRAHEQELEAFRANESLPVQTQSIRITPQMRQHILAHGYALSLDADPRRPASPQQRALWANQVTRECLIEAGDDVNAGLKAAQYILSTQPIPDAALSISSIDPDEVLPLSRAAHEATNRAIPGGHVQSKMALDAVGNNKLDDALMHHVEAAKHHNQVLTNPATRASADHFNARTAHLKAGRSILGPEGQAWEDRLKDMYPPDKSREYRLVYADWLEQNGYENYAKWQRLVAKEHDHHKSWRQRGLTLSQEPAGGGEHEHTFDEAHEVSAEAYVHGMNAIRSGDRTQHAKAAERHREAAVVRTRAGRRARGKVRELHKRMARAHLSSAKMHDRAATGGPALSLGDLLEALGAALAIDKPGFHPLHHKVEAALSGPGLSDEHRRQYKEAHRVLGRMSPVAKDRAHAATGRILFHPSHGAVARHAAATESNLAGKFREMLRSGRKPAGYFSYKHKTLHQAPDDTLSPEIFAHEIFHGVSNGQLHTDPEWLKAHQNEPSVTEYGRQSPSEGFAEFGRLTHASTIPLEQFERHHPLKTAFFKKNGIWPVAGPEGAAYTRELFEESVPVGGGGEHLDILRRAAAPQRDAAGNVVGDRLFSVTDDGGPPEVETDTALLFGAGEVGAAEGPVDDDSADEQGGKGADRSRRGDHKKNRGKREGRRKEEKRRAADARPVFVRVRPKQKWVHDSAALAVDPQASQPPPATGVAGAAAPQPAQRPGMLRQLLHPLARAAAAGVHKLVVSMGRRMFGAPELAVRPLNLRGQSIEHHTGPVRAALARAGMTDIWNEPWHENPVLRGHALAHPEGFERLSSAIRNNLTQAVQFGANAEVVNRKLAELEQLKREVADFHEQNRLPVAQLLPEHYGRRDAAQKHVQSILGHLESGGDETSALRHAMQHGGLAESSARRYVKKALELRNPPAPKEAEPPAQPSSAAETDLTKRPGGATLSTE